MKWVPDKTGRFSTRPHYTPDELDSTCEDVITSFLMTRRGRVRFPIATEDLTVLIEQEVDDLDSYADLSSESEPGEVEGVTEFRSGRRPRVRISRHLSSNPSMENRLRTTLTHEFGHVRFHGFLFEMEYPQRSLFPPSNQAQVRECKRQTIVGAPKTDWMEWQAGYSCGALLMPRAALKLEVEEEIERQSIPAGAIALGSNVGRALIERVAEVFQVSRDAARVRLVQRSYLVDGPANSSLFQGDV